MHSPVRVGSCFSDGTCCFERQSVSHGSLDCSGVHCVARQPRNAASSFQVLGNRFEPPHPPPGSAVSSRASSKWWKVGGRGCSLLSFFVSHCIPYMRESPYHSLKARLSVLMPLKTAHISCMTMCSQTVASCDELWISLLESYLVYSSFHFRGIQNSIAGNAIEGSRQALYLNYNIPTTWKTEEWRVRSSKASLYYITSSRITWAT